MRKDRSASLGSMSISLLILFSLCPVAMAEEEVVDKIRVAPFCNSYTYYDLQPNGTRWHGHTGIWQLSILKQKIKMDYEIVSNVSIPKDLRYRKLSIPNLTKVATFSDGLLYKH